ncbi:binding-protein-dependent transport systems inner membrane component [Photobacterium gaetbulicola Gung47]|uniref:Binding-protein-dependent transport systems inner membrane component n=1 Tax=Photobacterium gaetbulicola Gung47 TaxID=658445 RepID=A0A0C5W4T8_9GAMM|nr:sugar ABC transporter permease [Photobacterium gaetbulicola]AJR06486.1 binding-protein-dependent transport systems inner membrane component [Photobacterium gaetbulicola Gung47]
MATMHQSLEPVSLEDRKTKKPLLAVVKQREAWLFLLPMLVVLGGVALWPLLRTFYFSFTDASLTSPESAQFIGLENYYFLVTDPSWWKSVSNTLYFAVVSVSLETVLGLGIALILNANMPTKGLMRAVVLVPWAIPTIVSARMWEWMFHDQFGVVNHILLSLGVISEKIAWTADPNWSMSAIIFVDVWKTTPFMTLLILAGLQLLPKEVYEAAKVDNVSAWHRFVYITLPLLKPAILVAVVFRLLDALRMFDLAYVLTSSSESTMTMSVYARKQLVDFQDMGYGSAASTLLFFIVALVTVVYLYLSKTRTSRSE